MKTLFVCSLFVLCVSALLGKRDKRSYSLAVTGGCVVTGNQLFANGLPIRNLTSDEVQQITQYQSEMDNFIQQMNSTRSVIRQAMKKKMTGQELTQDEQSALNVSQSIQPPTVPDFCSGDDTVLYIFDGCMVQNNKVFVGGNFARDLSSQEQQQLKDYVNQVTAYQDYKAKQIQQEMSNVFGPSLTNWFTGDSSPDSSDSSDFSASSQSSTISPLSSTDNSPAPAIPKTPTFCYSF